MSKNIHTKSEIDDTRVVVKDFVRRPPYWSYRSLGYTPLKEFMEFQRNIDDYLEKLFQGGIDDGNGDVLDNMNIDIAMQALTDLAIQRVNHRNTIKDLAARFEGDRACFEEELRNLTNRLDQNLKKQSAIKEKIDKNEFKKGDTRNEYKE